MPVKIAAEPRNLPVLDVRVHDQATAVGLGAERERWALALDDRPLVDGHRASHP